MAVQKQIKQLDAHSPIQDTDVLAIQNASSGSAEKSTVAEIKSHMGVEANTASNVGSGGIGLYKQKTGVDLEFKNINAGSSKITVTDDVANSEVDIDVDEASIDLANCDNTTSAFITDTSSDTFQNKTITNTNNTLGGVTLTLGSDAHGDVYFRNGSGVLTRLAPDNGKYLQSNGAGSDPTWETVAGGGDVVGPASATDNAVARYDSTTGKLIQDSSVIIDDSGNITGVSRVSQDSVQFNTSLSTPTHNEGLMYYDQTNKCLAIMNDEADSIMQVGQELRVRVKNNTGSTITNGQVIYLNGVDGTTPTIALAKADSESTSIGTIALATHDIETATIGYATIIGTVRDINTSSFTAGDVLYLSADTAGAIVNTAPESPNYKVRVGVAGVINATTGTIEAKIETGDNTGGTIKFYNGGILETASITASSDGVNISCSVEQDGGGDLSLFFDGAFSIFDSTPAASVNLTAGSDTSPTLNYVYIPKSTMTLTANTTGFPTTEQYVPIATIVAQSAATAQTDGVMKLHAWTDHLAGTVGQGHLADINYWIRQQDATWIDGIATTLTITTNVGTPDNVDVAVSSGNVLQLHPHSYPAFDTSTGSDVYVVNDNTTPFDKVTDLNSLLTDSEGVSMSGKRFSLVLWGVVSEAESDCKLMLNLPSGSYGNDTDAINDPDKYSNFDIPSDYKGTGFLIARLVLRHQVTSGGTWTEIQTEDLRGKIPGSTAGSGTAQTTQFADNAFVVFDDGDNTKEMNFQLSGITTGTTRTLTVQDKDITIADNPMTTQGDIIYGGASGTETRLAIGTADYVLTVNTLGTAPEWKAASSGFSDPMTTRGDIIYRDATNTTTRLGRGTANQVLTSDGTDISWADAAGSVNIFNIRSFI